MDFPFDIPFARWLGLQLRQCEGGSAELTCTLRPELCNSWGVAHGGLVLSMLDIGMALASFSAPGNSEQAPCATVELKTSFMRPTQGLLLARAHVMHGGSRLLFCEASLFDQTGQPTAHATGTFTYIRRPAATGPPVPPRPA